MNTKSCLWLMVVQFPPGLTLPWIDTDVATDVDFQ